jgi:purine-binding chemotaxis protein CheW
MARESQTVMLAEDDQQLVVFELAEQSYAVDISAVNTIIRMQQITRVPEAPHFVEGVINLRGSILPVIDLRKRFALASGEVTKSSRIMIVEADGTVIGMVVDAVTETLKLPLSSIEPPSSVITDAGSGYVNGVGKLNNRLILLLDLAGILSEQEMQVLSS